MERVLIGTAAGGLALYLIYLLQKGEDPKVIQRVTSTVPAPKRDPKIEPKMSGSASSIVTAIANSGLDPQLDARPTDLGGDSASTGTRQPEATHKTLEQTAAAPQELPRMGGLETKGKPAAVVHPVESAPKEHEDQKHDVCTDFLVTPLVDSYYTGWKLKRQTDDQFKCGNFDCTKSGAIGPEWFTDKGWTDEQAQFFSAHHCALDYSSRP